MSRDKQIDEMCAIMADASYAACEDTPLVPESAGICDKVDCHRCKEARRLMSAGYRKASDVAREIFEEIEKTTASVYNDFMFNRDDVGMRAHYVVEFSDEIDLAIAELKKKYTEEGK